MTNINEENKDLIENRIPWALLDKETKERMKNWEYGTEFWSYGSGVWLDGLHDFYNSGVYRAKPAPERRECFVNVYPPTTEIYSSLYAAQNHGIQFGLVCRWKITSDDDGSNPTIEVI